MKIKNIFLTVNLLFLGEILGTAVRIGPESQSAVTYDEVGKRDLLGFLERAQLRKVELSVKDDHSADEQAALRRYSVYIEKIISEISANYKLYMNSLNVTEARIEDAYSRLAAKQSHTDEEMRIAVSYDKELDWLNEEKRRIRENADGLGIVLEGPGVFRELSIDTRSAIDDVYFGEEEEGYVATGEENESSVNSIYSADFENEEVGGEKALEERDSNYLLEEDLEGNYYYEEFIEGIPEESLSDSA